MENEPNNPRHRGENPDLPAHLGERELPRTFEEKVVASQELQRRLGSYLAHEIKEAHGVAFAELGQIWDNDIEQMSKFANVENGRLWTDTSD